MADAPDDHLSLVEVLRRSRAADNGHGHVNSGETQMPSSTVPVRRRMTRLATVVGAIIATLAMTFIPAAPAQAGSKSWYRGYLRLNNTCSGLGFSNRIRNEQIASGGWLRVYYSRSQGGINCANLINTTGRPLWLNIRIAYTRPGGADGGAYERGMYSSFAGSVLLKETSGRCIDLSGYVDDRDFDRVGVHCG